MSTSTGCASARFHPDKSDTPKAMNNTDAATKINIVEVFFKPDSPSRSEALSYKNDALRCYKHS
jgi:hypothetical protein